MGRIHKGRLTKPLALSPSDKPTIINNSWNIALRLGLGKSDKPSARRHTPLQNEPFIRNNRPRQAGFVGPPS